MKKNALYTANRWNGLVIPNKSNTFNNTNKFKWGGSWENLAFGDKQSNPWNYVDDADIIGQYKNQKNWLGISKANNPFSSGNIQSTMGGISLAAANPLGNFLGNTIGGGLQSNVGNAIGNIGGLAGTAIGAVNPLLGAGITVGSKIIGGVTNALWGKKINQEKKASNDAGTAAYRSFNSNASSFDDVQGPASQLAVKNAYSGGVFKKGWAKKKNAEARQDRAEAQAMAFRSVDNNVDNLVSDQLNTSLANYTAFGGPLETLMEDNDDMGAINYGFMSDYLTQKRQQTESKNKLSSITSFPTTFALGGDLQMHGGDYTTGLTHISAGGSHEENPYEGVQVGVDNEGTPNLVEEGETIFNDYVYSTRISADEVTKKAFHIPLKKEVSYADISKKLEKEASERPNDPISQAGLRTQMEMLAQHQERQKQEMEAARAKAAFEALSPEEQTAVMQEMAVRQQAAQQQAVSGGAPINEHDLAVQQQEQEQMAMQADGSEANLGQIPDMNAYGGKINKFAVGGVKKQLYKTMGWLTDKDFYTWAKANKLKDSENWGGEDDTSAIDATDEDWLKLIQHDSFKNAIKDNPALQDAISKGYDFGKYVPGNSTYDWDSFWQPVNEYSKQKSNQKTHYAIDKTYKGDIKELEGSDDFTAFTNYMLNNATDEERNAYFKWIDANTGNEENKYFVDGKLREDWKDVYNDKRNDGKYGIQHYTPKKLQRGDIENNYVINDDGTVDRIELDVPTDFQLDNSYEWQDVNNGYKNNYYRRPAVEQAANPDAPGTPAEEDSTSGLRASHRAEWPRYLGLLGPAVGLGMQMAGIGKPDYSGLEASLNVGNQSPTLAKYKPIGNYLTYKPLDIWYAQNRMDANARATDRNVINTSGGNRGAAMAGLLASGYNSQLGSGELFRQAQEYNFNREKDVEEFNRGTNIHNSNAFNETSRFNADALNKGRQYSASLMMDAAKARMAGDDNWYGSIYGNVSGLFKGLSDIGRENAEHNMVAGLWADGVGGIVTPDTYSSRGYVKKAKSSSRGGKIKRRRGLTL